MRTLVGSVDPPPRRPAGGYSFTVGNSASVVDAVYAFLAVEGLTLTPWQATVLSAAYGGHSGPRGPIVATAGPAFPPGYAVDVIEGEIVD